MNKQLDMEHGKELIDAIDRLTKLAALNSTSANAQAETEGLTEYIKNGMLEHAGHLMGCWFVIRTEYEPLCNAFASILNRAQAVNASRLRQQTSEAAVVNEAPPAEEPKLVEAPPPGAPIILNAHRPNGKR